jgi:site-specific DNA recombinase
MNCLIYVRVSTDKQAEKELSLPAQLEACRRFAADRGWHVSEEFVEPGFSARSTDRPALHQLLAACRGPQKIDTVLVHKIDRLARNVADHAAIRAILHKDGVKLSSVTENLDDSSSGMLVEHIMAAIAEFYSANLSDEVKKGMRQKVLKGGWPHRAPRGYRLTNGQIEVHPEDGPLVTKAFELYASGRFGLKPLTERLATEGLRTSEGKPFAPSCLHHILSNEFYTGRIRWNDLDLQGQHPPLVNPELFARVQVVIEERRQLLLDRRPPVPGFVLTQVGRCATCLGGLSADRQERSTYYRCSRRTYRKSACAARQYCRAKSAHEGIEALCDSMPLNEVTRGALIDAVIQSASQRSQIVGYQRRQLEERRDALILTESRLTDAFLAGDVSPDVYSHKNRLLRDDRAFAAAEVRRLQQASVRDERKLHEQSQSV